MSTPLERDLAEWRKKVNNTVYFGDPGGKPGLCTRMEIMEGNWDRVNKNLSKVVWLLVAVLLGVIANIITLIVITCINYAVFTYPVFIK